MKILKVFRVQPASLQRWKDFVQSLTGSSTLKRHESEFLRRHIKQACAKPPSTYPQREVKADLSAFSVFLDEADHAQLVRVAEAQGVSKNLFIEAMFNNLSLAT
ncbi:MAG: hypothetical protein Q7S87_01000 [Agitococcus sp.]|nr:hypothetical protein [Agitococcus sp.]